MPKYKPVPGQGNMPLNDDDAREAIRRLEAERKRKEEERKRREKEKREREKNKNRTGGPLSRGY